MSGEIRGAEELVNDLRQVRKKAVPYAIRNGLNTAAFEARRIWQAEIRASFTNRNQYTVRSVLVEQATTSRLVSRVGSTADYMKKQEEGGTVTHSSGRKPIPAPGAAGLQPGTSRPKLVRARFYLSTIKVDHPAVKGDRKQRNAIRMAVAKRVGSRVVMLERPNGTKGLFALMGSARKPTTRLLWVVGRSSVRVKAQPTLAKTLAAIAPKLPSMHQAAMLQQLNMLGVKTTAG